jgi:replication-associated recombination protein RarA
VYILKALESQLTGLLQHAITTDAGILKIKDCFSRRKLIRISGGDGRKLLNLLEHE